MTRLSSPTFTRVTVARRLCRPLTAIAIATLSGAMISTGSDSIAVAAPSNGPASRPGAGDVHAACPSVVRGQAQCFAEYVSGASTGGRPSAAGSTSLPRAVGPADIRSAYHLPLHGGKGKVVAIVDAYDNPTADEDLTIYRARYGLSSCTIANGCFRKVNQTGSTTSYPDYDPGWQLESSLDVDAVSAACPDCSILLVEADSPTSADLSASVDTAVRLGANVVSNSYGLAEDPTQLAFAADYSHPGVPILASTGDDGFEHVAQFPAVAPAVIAVGGTRLTPASNTRGWTETAWSGAASGCSAYVAKPAWQKDTHCHYRTISDVAADADPLSGLLVEDSGHGGMVQVGGTSLSSPIMAGILARGETRQMSNAAFLYSTAMRTHLNDVTSGSNGYCGGDYLCNALRGYDGPTGVGTPNGVPTV